MKIFEVDKNFFQKKKSIVQLKKKFNNDGVILINNVISERQCKQYKNLLDLYYDKFKKYYFKEKNQKFSGLSNAKLITNLHNKDLKFLNFLDNKLILPIVEILLKQGSYLNNDPVICQALTARSPLKKTEEQQLHNDSRIVGSKYPIVVQAMWIIDEFTKNNGATNFVLGSHKLLNYPKNNFKYKKLKTIEAKPGSVIIFNGATWHGSSKTKNFEGDRWAVITRYSRWFLKPSYDFLNNTPIKVFKKMNKKQKDLLGFRFYSPLDEFTGNKIIHKDYYIPKKYKLPK